MRDYTENELCETVFYLARYAECLEIDKTITVTDERELFWMILEWAQEFERNFDPSGEKDHSIELETQGPQWLRETFPYMPEEDVARKAIIDFVNFESATSVVWPWASPRKRSSKAKKYSVKWRGPQALNRRAILKQMCCTRPLTGSSA